MERFRSGLSIFDRLERKQACSRRRKALNTKENSRRHPGKLLEFSVCIAERARKLVRKSRELRTIARGSHWIANKFPGDLEAEEQLEWSFLSVFECYPCARLSALRKS